MKYYAIIYLLLSDLMAKIRESEEHSKSKIIEHFLSGFKPDDSEWIKFLADVFFDIFCNYNFQMIWLLKHPVDAWSKVRNIWFLSPLVPSKREKNMLVLLS